MSKQRRNRSARKMAKPTKGFAKRILPTLTEVCSSSDAFLGKLDIAALNLICASGLPGAESLVPQIGIDFPSENEFGQCSF